MSVSSNADAVLLVADLHMYPVYQRSQALFTGQQHCSLPNRYMLLQGGSMRR